MIKLTKSEKKFFTAGGIILISLFFIFELMKLLKGSKPVLSPENTGTITSYIPAGSTTTTPTTIFKISQGIEGKKVKSAQELEGFYYSDLSGMGVPIPAGASLGTIKNILVDSTELTYGDLNYFIDNDSKVKYE